MKTTKPNPKRVIHDKFITEMQRQEEFVLFSGTTNTTLAKNVAAKLRTRLGSIEVSRFSDGEIRVELGTSVRGKDVFIIQSFSAPVNDSLMEAILIADAAKRSSAKTITMVAPLYPYSRQDRRPGYSRVPISARVVAEMFEGVGVDHMITVDLHATQIQGFFSIPVDNISASQLFCADVWSRWIDNNPIIVSPDVGGVARARALAKQLNNIDLAIIDKRRPRANVSEVMNIIGDVKGKTCIVVDDMVDTAGTLGKAADALIDVGGAAHVVAYASHGVLSGKASDNIAKSKLDELVVTDTVPLSTQILSTGKVRQISVAGIVAETISRISHSQSVSEILDA